MGTSLHSTIFATMRDPAMILNSDFKFVDVNQSYCTLVQMTREDLIGQDFMDLFMSSPAEREFATKLFQMNRTHPKFRFKNSACFLVG